jgi:hypothetical protein
MSGSRAVVVLLYALFFLATNWPVLILANRIEPRIGPFPFLVFWMLFWSIGIGIVHLWYGLYCLGDPRVPAREAITVREEGE